MDAGQRLRARIEAELADRQLELDGREQELLDRACATADQIEQLETVLAVDGPTTLGSSGQVVLHPAVAEIRLQKVTLHRLLSSLDLAGDAAAPGSASARGTAAAKTRWAKHPVRQR